MLQSRSGEGAAARRKAAVRATFGLNRVIIGDYDEALAARCDNGTYVGRSFGGVTEWRGIPYALPPTGPRRWKKPEQPLDNSGIFQAYYNGRSPIQTEWETEQASYYPQGEDCLYLNVWSDLRVQTQPGKAVMVFFHGGSYGWGGTADPMYDGKNLINTHGDVVLVTVGYRTGLMGFVDFSAVPGGEDYPDAPNLGLLDQIEALRWVRRNISAFGGDPDNVTIFGESAGGGSVSLLPIIPAARGLFRRVIAESGSVALTFSREECQDFTERLMRHAGADSMSDLLSLTERELKKINEPLNFYNNFPQRDGLLIPADAYGPYDRGETVGIDMLIGTNANEMNYWVGEVGGIVPYRFSAPIKFENDLPKLSPADRARVGQFIRSLHGHKIWRISEFYNELMFRLPAIRQAESHAKNGGRAYMYYWTQPSSIAYRGACHAVELAYVFGNHDQTIYTGDSIDRKLSSLTMKAWTDFAKTGNPDPDGTLGWVPYTLEEHRPTMVLSTLPHVQRDLLDEQRVLLDPLLDYWLSASYATLDYNVPFVRKLAGIGVGILAAVGVGCALALHSRNK